MYNLVHCASLTEVYLILVCPDMLMAHESLYIFWNMNFTEGI